MGSAEKSTMFELVYADGSDWLQPLISIDYTDPTTGQKVTHTIMRGDSYSFPCAIGDTVKIYNSGYGVLPKLAQARAIEKMLFRFLNGVNVSPTTGQFTNNGSCTFTITGKSPFLNYTVY